MGASERRLNYTLTIQRKNGEIKKDASVIFKNKDIHHPTVVIGDNEIQGTIKIVDAHKAGYLFDGSSQSNSNDGSHSIHTKVIKLTFSADGIANSSAENQKFEFSLGEYSPLLGIAHLGLLTTRIYKGEEVDNSHQKVMIKKRSIKTDKSTIHWLVSNLEKEEKDFESKVRGSNTTRLQSTNIQSNDPFKVNWNGFIYRHYKKNMLRWKNVANDIKRRLDYSYDNLYVKFIREADPVTQYKVLMLLKDFLDGSDGIVFTSNLLGGILFQYMRNPQDEKLLHFISKMHLIGRGEKDKLFIKHSLIYLFGRIRMFDIPLNDDRYSNFICDLLLSLDSKDYNHFLPTLPEKLKEIIKLRMTEIVEREQLLSKAS